MAVEKAGKAPDIPVRYTHWFIAYTELISCRTDRGLIPWDSIARYAEVYGLSLEMLRRIVRRVDTIVMERENKRLIKKPA